MAKFKVGDKAYKPTGYKFPCTIVSVFTTTTGETRIVAEMDEYNMLHIFNENQLEPRGVEVTTRQLTSTQRFDWWFKNLKPNRDIVDSYDDLDCLDQDEYLNNIGIPSATVSVMIDGVEVYTGYQTSAHENI